MNDYLNFKEIAEDKKFSAITRVIAWEFEHNGYGNTGKVLNEIALSDLYELHSKWRECMEMQKREGIPFPDQRIFQDLTFICLMLRQAEHTYPMEEELINPGFDVNLLMTFVTLMMACRIGEFVCKDIRKLTLSADFLKQDYRSLFEVNENSKSPAHAGNALEGIFDSLDILRSMEIDGVLPEGVKLFTFSKTKSSEMQLEDYLRERREKNKATPSKDSQYQDRSHATKPDEKPDNQATRILKSFMGRDDGKFTTSPHLLSGEVPPKDTTPPGKWTLDDLRGKMDDLLGP